MPIKIAVVGAGVIGVTTAYKLVNDSNNAEITLISEEFSPNTTGDGSAGFLMPYALGKTSSSSLFRWCKETLDFIQEFSLSEKAGELGIGLLSVYYLSEKEKFEHFNFSDVFLNYRELTEKEVSMFPSNWKSGVKFTSYYVECCKFLPYLMKQYTDKGGIIIKKRVNNLKTLNDYDVVINCCGINSSFLNNDLEVKPVRGQVLKVRAPWVKHAIVAGSNYILPNSEWVILGGTLQKGDWNAEVDEKDSQKILEGCTQLLPSLAKAEVINEWVGLRPYREYVCIEHKVVNNENEKKVHMIHNYGHGGSGVTLSWGCANEVFRLLISVIREIKV